MPARPFLALIALLGLSGIALAQEAQSGAAAPPAPGELRATAAYPALQDPNQLLGLSLIGAKVISANGETIGRVANLIMDENGTVASVVIGVGGLLGMGTKNVAVTYQSLNIERNRAGDAIDHVTLAATKDELLRAAAFKSLHQQTAEAQAKR
jgi:hypothetical protein